MTRPEITDRLAWLLEDHINPRRDPRIYLAKEVTFDYMSGHSVRVDYMKFEPINNSVSGIEKGDFYCYEIKSSLADYRSRNGHNFIGDYNYYVMPMEVYSAVKEEIPYDIGVYVPDAHLRQIRYPGEIMRPHEDWNFLTSVKKAHRHDRERPMCEMLLMMFRSCARDARKGENR